MLPHWLIRVSTVTVALLVGNRDGPRQFVHFDNRSPSNPIDSPPTGAA